MSLVGVVNAIQSILNTIESDKYSNGDEEVYMNIVKDLTLVQEDDLSLTEKMQSRLKLLKTLKSEKEVQELKFSTLIGERINRLEKLKNETAALQARIESIEDNLKQNTMESNENFIETLQNKRDCMWAWKFFTNVTFDFSNPKVAGFIFYIILTAKLGNTQLLNFLKTIEIVQRNCGH